MFTYVKHRKKKFLFSAISRLIVFALSSSLIFSPTASYAQSILNLPIPGTMITPSPAFVPVLLKGMTIHPDDPLKFDFIIDSGNTNFNSDEIKKESERLVKYFLASVTVPKDDLWVNLSPYENDRIIPNELGKTELGRDMLAQDYILKQLTASLMYPEEELGKKFWDKVYSKAEEQFGTREIPVNTFNKVWILPESATVYEHEQTVYVVDAHLKVMLDSDYQAMQYEKPNTQDSNLELQSSIIKEIIIPEIEKEVNEGQHFAPLRQIYHSLILAKWYKETIKNSLLSQVYVGQNKIAGVESGDETVKDQIYSQYMEAYKRGVFNYIKEDYDRLSKEVIPRKYFSGGIKGDVSLKRSSSPINESKSDKYQASVQIIPQEKGVSSPISEETAEMMIRERLDPKYYHLIKLEHVRKVVESEGNFGILYHDGSEEGFLEGIEVFQMAFNPLQALNDGEIFNVFVQIIERRYDVRVLEGKYGLGRTPDQVTFKGRKITVKQFAREMAQFLLNHADDNPYDVANRFRMEFLRDGPPPELKSFFDKYMAIKPEVFDLEVIRDLIPQNGNVADIGAGHNVLGKKILEYSDNNGLQVRYMVGTGINKWEDDMDRTDERLSFVHQESSINFPLSANSYDTVIVKWVLHHMTLEDQKAFLKDIERILKPGGRLIVFESLGANQENEEIWRAYKDELRNESSWGPKGDWREANLKLNRDFRKLTDKQQKRLHALEDYFGHNVVMNRVWMPQPYTYRTVSEFQELLDGLGFNENKEIRRVYGTAPIIRMGPPSIRLVFEKKETPITLIKGDGGHNKAMVLIDGISSEEREHMKTALGVLVYQDMLRRDLEKEKLDDIVIMGNERLDTFEEALQLLNLGIGQRIVILGGFGKATIPLIGAAVKQGFEVEISPGVYVNRNNWEDVKESITEDTRANVIQFSEASIIKQIVEQIIKGWPGDYQNLLTKIELEGIENVILTEGSSVFIKKLLVNYRKLLDKEGAFEKVGGHRVVFLQKPHLQLRAKAAFDELFAAELRNHTVNTVSHTVSYDNVESDKISAFQDVIKEAWRLVLYSDYGKGYINLRGIYPKGIDGIPNEFWESMNFLLSALSDQERQELTRELMFLVAKEGLSIDEVIPEDNFPLRKFIARVQDGASSSPVSNNEEVGGIDLNRIDVERQGSGVNIRFDSVEIQEMINMGIDGFAPVIINLVPLPSVLPLLGLEPRKENEEFELSQMN